jgi:hypothetical protein
MRIYPVEPAIQVPIIGIIDVTTFEDRYTKGIDQEGNMYEDRGHGWEPKPKTDLQSATEELDAYLAVKP